MAQLSCLAPPNLAPRNRQGNPSRRRPPRQEVLGIRLREVGARLRICTNHGGGTRRLPRRCRCGLCA